MSLNQEMCTISECYSLATYEVCSYSLCNKHYFTWLQLRLIFVTAVARRHDNPSAIEQNLISLWEDYTLFKNSNMCLLYPPNDHLYDEIDAELVTIKPKR